jgi:hypothetical protein
MDSFEDRLLRDQRLPQEPIALKNLTGGPRLAELASLEVAIDSLRSDVLKFIFSLSTLDS